MLLCWVHVQLAMAFLFSFVSRAMLVQGEKRSIVLPGTERARGPSLKGAQEGRACGRSFTAAGFIQILMQCPPAWVHCLNPRPL